MTYNKRTFPKTFALEENTRIKFVLEEADDQAMLYYYHCMYPRDYDRSAFDLGMRVTIVDKHARTTVMGVVDSYDLQTPDHIEKGEQKSSTVCFRCAVKVESVTQF
jgi:hypothetical protein